MKISKLIGNNLHWYWKKHLLLVAGIAVSGAVITGALVVGDSVRHSLDSIVDQRLGRVTHVLNAGERYFTDSLSLRVADRTGAALSTVLLQEGSAAVSGGKLRVNRVQVLGVDRGFDHMASQDELYGSLTGDSVIMSANLARRLNMEAGDEVLLRIEKASMIPPNAPFVSDEESMVSLRVTLKGIAGEGELGAFNLKVSQIAPFNIFISRERLQEVMDFRGRSNVLLLESDNTSAVHAAIDGEFTLADAGLRLEQIHAYEPDKGETQLYEIKSERVFIGDRSAVAIAAGTHGGRGILTYFVNSITSPSGSTPYSFVSTLPDSLLGEKELIINEWLAEDLGAGKGDTLGLTWFRVGPLRELSEEGGYFIVKEVIPLEGSYGDRELMPDLPGLSDAGNCRDWNTGVPIELDDIRDKDEDYWDDYGGIPKAFVSISAGQTLWSNRFGSLTAWRFGAGEMPRSEEAGVLPHRQVVESQLMAQIRPWDLGFSLEEAREKGLHASGNGVDFSQLFAGLSFFLLVAGILLTILLVLYNLETRMDQLRTLRALGYPVKRIRQIMMAESNVIAIAGSIAGILLGIVYNAVVFRLLNGVWKDVVRAEMMHTRLEAPTLVTGFLITVFIAWLAMRLPLGRKLRKMFGGGSETAGPDAPGRRNKRFAGKRKAGQLSLISGLLTWILALMMILMQLGRGEGLNTPVFFLAGGMLLLSMILLFATFLERRSRAAGAALNMALLGWKNASRNPTRSRAVVILFAIGAFLVISTGSNRKDLFEDAQDPSGGTGGYLYFAESTLPFLRDMNDPGVRSGIGLEGAYGVVQLRKAEGDDASCLNLNKIVNPRILGLDPEQLEGRFSFVSSTGLLDPGNPWSSLDQELDGGLIPAIADETVIKWGLGMTVGDTLLYSNSEGAEMKLLLIGGLAPSVFQGSVLISEGNFLENFPQSSGSSVFLVGGQLADTADIMAEMGRGFRDLGWEMEFAPVRLSRFNSVTNAYLSIFMAMGALGLLLGTFGLVVILSRSILERKKEIALLRAVGFSRKAVRRLIVREYMALLGAGIGVGFLSAVLATLPSLLSSNTGASALSILFWLAVLLLNGWLWIALLTGSMLKKEELTEGLRDE